MRNMDPYHTKARFASKCSGCKAEIAKGAAIFYYPASKSAYGEACDCATARAADFAGACADDDFYNA